MAGERLPSLTIRGEVISSGPWLDSLFSVLMDAESKQLCLLAELFISLFLSLSFSTFSLSVVSPTIQLMFAATKPNLFVPLWLEFTSLY